MPGVQEGLVLVTGASGYIGSHVVYQLLDFGYKVRGTVRNTKSEKASFLSTFHPKAKENLELVAADLLGDTDAWEKVMEGVDFVMHVASPFTTTAKKEEDVVRPAVQGTRSVIEAAKKCPTVKGAVVTASVVCCYEGTDTTKRKIDDLLTEDDYGDESKAEMYGKSKLLAEKEAFKIATEGESNFRVTTILPAYVMGPVFSKFQCDDSQSCKHVKMLLMKEVPGLPDATFTFSDVRDVALAHVKAMRLDDEKAAGKRFIVVGESDDAIMTFAQQAALLSDLFKPFGFNPINWTIPGIVLKIFSPFSADIGAAAKVSGSRVCASNKLMKETLEITPRRFRDSMYDHVISMVSVGHLPQKKIPQETLDSFKVYRGEEEK